MSARIYWRSHFFQQCRRIFFLYLFLCHYHLFPKSAHQLDQLGMMPTGMMPFLVLLVPLQFPQDWLKSKHLANCLYNYSWVHTCGWEETLHLLWRLPEQMLGEERKQVGHLNQQGRGKLGGKWMHEAVQLQENRANSGALRNPQGGRLGEWPGKHAQLSLWNLQVHPNRLSSQIPSWLHFKRTAFRKQPFLITPPVTVIKSLPRHSKFFLYFLLWDCR